MNEVSNFLLAWVIYIIAGGCFYFVFWRLTDFKKHRFMAYGLRAIALAVIATPWYVNDQESLLAPALMVMTMDAITIGGSSAVRAFVPLFMTIVVAIIGVSFVFLISKGVKAKTRKSAQQSE
jgi:preprotein translocase subunit YajC